MRITVYLHRFLFLAFPLFISGGCAHKAMDYSIAAWQNKPAQAVIESWGIPSEDLRVNGKHLLIWNTAGGEPVLKGKSEPGRPPVDCMRLLEADRNGRIVAGTWDGKDCPGWFSGWYW